jgi:hypothetical protein
MTRRFVGVAVLWLTLGSMSLSQSPTVTFKGAKIEEHVGDKIKYSDAVLMYSDGALVIHADNSSLKEPRILKTIMYADVVGAGYYRLTAPFLNSVKSHWMNVRTGTDHVLLRLDKNNYKLVLAEFEKRTGKKVKGLDRYE